MSDKFEHNFYDCDIKVVKGKSDDGVIFLKIYGHIIGLIKEDVIAMAKHFDLKEADL